MYLMCLQMPAGGGGGSGDVEIKPLPPTSCCWKNQHPAGQGVKAAQVSRMLTQHTGRADS